MASESWAGLAALEFENKSIGSGVSRSDACFDLHRETTPAGSALVRFGHIRR